MSKAISYIDLTKFGGAIDSINTQCVLVNENPYAYVFQTMTKVGNEYQALLSTLNTRLCGDHSKVISKFICGIDEVFKYDQ